MEDTEMTPVQPSKADHSDDDDLEITLKPLGITTIHKRDVTMKVSPYQRVGDFA